LKKGEMGLKSERDVEIEAERNHASPAALVIGGGIAGIQAALDIADAGFKVYLVEREPTIGGHMAQLDKTFPTLDCSSCILTPKMVDVARHPNIELMTYSEVVGVQGQKGCFRVKVRNKPRYIDVNECTGCGDCVKNCPVEVDSEFDVGLVKRKAIYRPFPQAVPNAFVIDKKETPPCKMACPLRMDVQGYIALIRVGKFKEAYELIRRTNPLPAVCGRVCYHPCEEECKRNHLDDPLAIRALKRFACEQFDINELEIPEIEKNGRRVAIVGSGPAGLTAAHDLALMGFSVTIFEALPEPGGMLRVGIPEYRLPKAILKEEIGYIERLGVEIKTNTRIGEEITLEDLRRDYEAVFIATGAHESRKLRIPGEEADGVIHGMDFLRRVNLGEEVEIGDRVAVIGGGNTAIDAARVARRLGARDVSILYRRSRAEMPALAEEVEAAEAEGINITFLVTPTRVLVQDGKVSGLEVIRMKLGEPDASGRPRPIPIEGSEFTVSVDTVIPALGQFSEVEFAKALGLETERGRLVVDEETMATNVEGVFAGGDVVTGPWIAIQAMSTGRRAARAIDQYLRGEPMHVGEFEVLRPPTELTAQEIEELRRERGLRHRLLIPELQPAERIVDFREVELAFTPEAAMEEAARCLECGVCSECWECVKLCERGAIDHEQREEIVELEVGAIVVAIGYDQFDPHIKPELGYGQYPNVITGLEFERLSSASGPTGGRISLNGREPREVVFIQCVGSRDQTVGNEYCSRVCCMYTAKQAHLVKERIPGANVTVFYMDVRAFGKGFEEFYDRVKHEGVMYRRGSVSEIYKRGDRVVVRAEDTLLGEPLEIEADLVVLATGVVPRVDVEDVAGLLNLERSPDGFFAEAHPKMRPVDTVSDGIYLAGCCQGPKDIPDTVAQAKAAAASAIVVLRQEQAKLEVQISKLKYES
jgi:heterodisulfide reductase subunit A